MIEFRQKAFTEYDAMRSFFVELSKRNNNNYNDRQQRWKVIDKTSLLPILKGNNIVIERFVISTSLLGRDKYRMYLKIGAKVNMPDKVRLPELVRDKKLGNAYISLGTDIKANDNNNNNDNGGKKKKKNNNDNTFVRSTFTPLSLDIKYNTGEPLGEVIKYSKKERSLVLEFSSIGKAIEALNVLPFGLNYNIFLLS
jgi:hypothetical protein